MRLAVQRGLAGERVVIDDGRACRALEFATMREAIAAGVLDEPGAFRGTEIAEPGEEELAPMVSGVTKVLCVGHNFRQHIAELGQSLPDHPNVFSKYPEALIGPRDDISLDPRADLWDWEAELAFLVKGDARNVGVDDAHAYIAGYTVANDISARDWQSRASQWLLGKSFESTTPLGPWLIPTHQIEPGSGLTISCAVDGAEKQRSSTADLLFTPEMLLSYLSQVLTLRSGDVVLTGTPGGVGIAREPIERLVPGQVVTTEIELVGRLENTCVSAGAATVVG